MLYVKLKENRDLKCVFGHKIVLAIARTILLTKNIFQVPSFSYAYLFITYANCQRFQILIPAKNSHLEVMYEGWDVVRVVT